MAKVSFNNKINYKNLQYYQNCDFINKFNLNSSFSKPCIKKLVVEISLKSLQDSLKLLKLKSYTKKNIENISFLIFYLISQQIPYVFFKSTKPENSQYKQNFFLRINFNSSSKIYSFLQNIMYTFSDKNQITLKQKNCLTFINKYPIYNFFELENVFSKRFKNINFKDFTFFLKLNLNKIPENLKNQKLFLKNFLL